MSLPQLVPLRTNNDLQRSLDLSHNNINTLPEVTELFSRLEVLNISYNNLNTIPSPVLALNDLDVSHNPLTAVIPAYRSNKTLVIIAFHIVCFMLTKYCNVGLELLERYC